MLKIAQEIKMISDNSVHEIIDGLNNCICEKEVLY